MTGSRCFLDTSIIIHFFKNNSVIIDRLKRFEEVFVSSTVVGELYYGAYASANPQKHIIQIQSFLSDCVVVEVDVNTAVIYGQLKAELKRKGTPIPENDIWIESSSIEQNIPLFTTDKHFWLMKLDLVVL